MVTLNKVIHDSYRRLKQEGCSSLTFWGFPVTARLASDGSKLILSAPVFRGEGYIPESVRASAGAARYWALSTLPTSLHLDEKRHEISLRYIGKAEKSERAFKGLLEEFSSLASEWRGYLDERGGNDFVYVRRSS